MTSSGEVRLLTEWCCDIHRSKRGIVTLMGVNSATSCHTDPTRTHMHLCVCVFFWGGGGRNQRTGSAAWSQRPAMSVPRPFASLPKNVLTAKPTPHGGKQVETVVQTICAAICADCTNHGWLPGDCFSPAYGSNFLVYVQNECGWTHTYPWNPKLPTLTRAPLGGGAETAPPSTFPSIAQKRKGVGLRNFREPLPTSILHMLTKGKFRTYDR